jgi:uncharacterized protein YjbJ (UPF0337 family)
MTDDTTPGGKAGSKTGRARQAKGSVQEAIGKIIGDPGVERSGRRESKAGAEQARAEPHDADHFKDRDGAD